MERQGRMRNFCSFKYREDRAFYRWLAGASSEGTIKATKEGWTDGVIFRRLQ